MQAIILAAGKGTRLKNLTKNIPKALIKVNEKTLLEYCLDFLNKNQIKKIVIVTGYKTNLIEEYINKSSKYKKEIIIAKNPNYELGNIISLKTAIPYIDDSFLIMNVDHIYYNAKIFEKIVKKIDGITAICDFDRILEKDDMKVLLDENLKIIKINKSLSNYNGGYTGITICHKDYLELYFKTVNNISNDYKGMINVEEVIQTLQKKGIKINICDISNLGWLEIDTNNDLKKAIEKMTKK